MVNGDTQIGWRWLAVCWAEPIRAPEEETAIKRRCHPQYCYYFACNTTHLIVFTSAASCTPPTQNVFIIIITLIGHCVNQPAKSPWRNDNEISFIIKPPFTYLSSKLFKPILLVSSQSAIPHSPEPIPYQQALH